MQWKLFEKLFFHDQKQSQDYPSDSENDHLSMLTSSQISLNSTEAIYFR